MEITYIRAVFGALKTTTTKTLFQIDSGVILQVAGIADLPEYFQADFSTSEKGTATRILGHDGEAIIPDQLLKTGLPIWCWIYVTNEITGRTVYTVKIPVKQRSIVEGVEPTPEQADIINQAIAALNSAGDSAQQSAESASQSAQEAAQSEQASRGYSISASQASTAAEAYMRNARTAATNAGTSESKAKAYAQSAEIDASRAEMAAHTAGFFWLEVDANEDLIFIRTDNAPVNIYKDENDDLIVEAF